MSTLAVDTVFDYPADTYPWPGHCHLRIYDQGGGDAVLVLTELADNPGASVTNAIELIVTAAVRRYGLDPARMRVIEHHDDRRAPGPPVIARRESEGLEDFDEVTFAHVPAQRPVVDGEGHGAHASGDPDGDLPHDCMFSGPSWRHLSRRQAEAMIGQPLP